MSVPQIPQQQAAPQNVQQPQQPQSNDEAIGEFSRALLQEIDSNPDPDDPDALRGQQQEGEEPSQEAEPTTDDPEAETPTPEPEVPLVEVEIDGKKFTIPEEVKHRVMADKDYRQKTQEVAATRKNFEAMTATAQKLIEQAQQMAPYHAQLFQMDNHANYLNQRLQSPELANDPLEFNRVQGELAILLRNRDAFAQGLGRHADQLKNQQRQLQAQKWAADAPALLKDFPELQKPETLQKLAKHVQESGLEPEAVEFLNFSAVGIRMAWESHQYREMVKDQAAARSKLQEKVKTLPSATSTSRAVDASAKDKQLLGSWKKGGGKLNDPALDAILRSKFRR